MGVNRERRESAGRLPDLPGNANGRRARWNRWLGAALLVALPGLARAQAPQPAASEPCAASAAATDPADRDWPNLCRYRAANAEIAASGRRPGVVFLGDSITENWEQADPAFFGGDIADRGISGQTTSQILLRVYPDVVALHPEVVHIMAGTNDVAGNTGPVSDDTVVDNIRAMIDIARANRIKVILASIPPAAAFAWAPAVKPAARIEALNRRLRALASEHGAVWVDYHRPLADAAGGLPAGLASDGVHPNRDGYAVMRPLAEAAIREARRRSD